MSPGFKESAAIGPLADGSFAYRWPLPSTCEQHDGNQAARLSTAVLACEVQGGRRGSELGSLKSDMHVEDEAASRPAFGRGCPARLAVTCCKVRLSKSASSVRCEATRRLRPRVGFPNVIFYFILFFYSQPQLAAWLVRLLQAVTSPANQSSACGRNPVSLSLLVLLLPFG